MKVRDPLDVLKQFVAKYPTQQAAADALGISTPYLIDLLKGRRGWSEVMLAKLGLERAVIERRSA